jgi:hypothetical protein
MNFAKLTLSQIVIMALNQASRSFCVGASVRQGDALLAIPVLLVCIFYSDSGYVSWCTTLVVVAEAAVTEVVVATLTVIMMTMTMMSTTATTAVVAAAAATTT